MRLSQLILGISATIIALVSSRPINSELLVQYDYIIVGGGPAGLTVANRLSEDPNITVLVLEAGRVPDESEINLFPVRVGLNIFTPLNWQLYTAPQTYLNGEPRYFPLGKALGGGTAINGMLWNRGGQQDYDDWVTLGNPGWGWKDMLPYFQKSERFTPYRDIAPNANVNKFGVHFNPPYHGYDGPVNVSYSKYIYPASENFFNGLNEATRVISPVWDANAGRFIGGTFLPVNIDPHNQTRCDARHAHYDPYAYRRNFYVSTGQQVTRLLFDEGECSGCHASSNHQKRRSVAHEYVPMGRAIPKQENVHTRKHRNEPMYSNDPSTSDLKRVIGVEYASGPTSSRKTVFARREVILAAGAIHTPQLLELSGIGEPQHLSSLNITPIINLPGVGANHQDHFLVPAIYPYTNTSYTYPTQLNNGTIDAAARAEYLANRTGPYTAGPPDGVAFLSLSQISDRAVALLAVAESGIPNLQLELDETVRAGYAAQRRLLLANLGNRTRAAIEILPNSAGSLVVSNMRPFTRGSIHITSLDPFTAPSINPRYGSEPIDLLVLREALLFNRKLLLTPAMQLLQPSTSSSMPSADADDEELVDYVKTYGGTEYHSSGTAAMLPREHGGVVDAELRVYGTVNLRIVDTNVYPLLPAAHLQSVVYAVAEKGADIIKEAARGDGVVGGEGHGHEVVDVDADKMRSCLARSRGLVDVDDVVRVSGSDKVEGVDGNDAVQTPTRRPYIAFPAPAYDVPAQILAAMDER